MKLKYDNKEITLVECKSFFSRFRGFMLKRNINISLLFDHCNSIHTFFMLEKIDVIFCDENNNILYFYKDLGPNKIILPKKGVKKVYEVQAGYFDIKVHNKLEVKE